MAEDLLEAVLLNQVAIMQHLLLGLGQGSEVSRRELSNALSHTMRVVARRAVAAVPDAVFDELTRRNGG